jgi:chemotaxis protein histidine kinase CheA
MTQDKALKSAIRARMAESGEPYNVARRAVMADGKAESPEAESPEAESPEPASTGDEDYYARYLREAEESGVPSDQIAAMAIADRLQEAADRAQDAADLAEEVAEQAEETADEAEEKANLAEESASLAMEWADPEEQEQAQRRSDAMRERADRAREAAERARERAEQAQERAELAQEAADQAQSDDEDDGPSGDWHGPRGEWHGRPPGGWPGHRPTPPRPPRPPRPPQSYRVPASGMDRLLGRLAELEQRFGQVQDRAAEFVNRFITDQDQDRGRTPTAGDAELD